MRFFDVFNAATRGPGLKASERWLLCVLMSFDGERGICPRLDTIASRSGFEKGAVLRATKRLEARGVLTVTRSTNAPNVYTVHLDRIRALAAGSETEPGTNSQPGSETEPGTNSQPGSETTQPGLQNATGQVAKRHWAGSETLPDQSLDQSLDLSPSLSRAEEPAAPSDRAEPPLDLLTNPPAWREERVEAIAMTTGRRPNDVAASWAEFASSRADKSLPVTPEAWAGWVARQIRFDGETARRGRPSRVVQRDPPGGRAYEVDDGNHDWNELAEQQPRMLTDARRGHGTRRVVQRDPPGERAYEVAEANDFGDLATQPARKFDKRGA